MPAMKGMFTTEPLNVDERLVTDLIVACQAVADRVGQLGDTQDE